MRGNKIFRTTEKRLKFLKMHNEMGELLNIILKTISYNFLLN